MSSDWGSLVQKEEKREERKMKYVALITSLLCLGTSEVCTKKLQILCTIFANVAQHFNPFFSMVKLSVTPLYYPEYRGLLVHLS